MNDTLFVRPAGGLCNRLYAIASAFIYARELGLDCRIHWVADPACACAPSDLFAGIPTVSDREVAEAGIEFVDVHETADSMNLPARASAAAGQGLYAYFKFKSARRSIDDYEERLHRELSALRVVPEVASALMPLPPRTIGMHLRRGDHWRSWRYSPASLFYRAAARHLADDPAARLFLATDSPALEARFRARFPGKVLSYAGRNLSRASPEGVRAALVDLLTLAETERIYGSFSSSFSMLAARFRNIPLQILKRRGFPRDWNERPSDVRHDRSMHWLPETARWAPRPQARPGNAAVAPLAKLSARCLAAYVQSELYQQRIPWVQASSRR